MSNSSPPLSDRLERIESHLISMADDVAERVAEVTSAMLEADVERADSIIAAGREMGRRSLHVEEQCIETLVADRPTETDL
ncbi:MAG: hypothetical protein GY773_16175, partial [Actinomycetia bacterium]|nr:hypothetical protein [Actinomycetes bacterium]